MVRNHFQSHLLSWNATEIPRFYFEWLLLVITSPCLWSTFYPGWRTLHIRKLLDFFARGYSSCQNFIVEHGCSCHHFCFFSVILFQVLFVWWTQTADEGCSYWFALAGSICPWEEVWPSTTTVWSWHMEKMLVSSLTRGLLLCKLYQGLVHADSLLISRGGSSQKPMSSSLFQPGLSMYLWCFLHIISRHHQITWYCLYSFLCMRENTTACSSYHTCALLHNLIWNNAVYILM